MDTVPGWEVVTRLGFHSTFWWAAVMASWMASPVLSFDLEKGGGEVGLGVLVGMGMGEAAEVVGAWEWEV